MIHGKPQYEYEVDLGAEQLWQLLDDAQRNRDLESCVELVHKLSMYLSPEGVERVIQ